MSSNLHILIVEDIIVTARGLEQKLRSLGYEHIHLAHNSETCLAIMEAQPIDLVLMDIGLGDGEADGIETARAVNDTYDVPIIFLTAYSDTETISRTAEVQHTNYLIKPVNDRQLYVAIHRALRERHPVLDLQSWSVPPVQRYDGAIFVKGEKKYYERIEVKDIVYIEAQDSGVSIQLLQGKYFTYNTLQALLDILQGYPILRIHKSVAINKDHVIAKSENEVIMRDGVSHVIGRSYADALDEQFLVVRPRRV